MFERLPGHVQLGLADQERCPGLERVTQLAKQPMEIVDLVNHPKRDCETKRVLGCEPEVVGTGLDEIDPICKPASSQSSRGHGQHATLYIHCDDSAFSADETRQPFGIEAGAASDVENAHSRPSEGAEDLVWIMKPPADRVVEAADEPPRANVSHDAILAHLREFLRGFPRFW